MTRVTRIACVAACACACGGTAKPATDSVRAATVIDAGSDAAPPAPAPEPVEPWPSAKPGAAWTVVEWKMNEHDASEALAHAGFDPKARVDESTGRVEAIDVTSPLKAWKASVAFDAKTNQVAAVTIHGDPATIPQARAERAQLEERFGAPAETHVHWSKQCANDRAIEIEGPLPGSAWRVTQSLTRQGDAKSPVEWPSLKDFTWGLPFPAIAPAMKNAGFVREKLPPPPAPPKAKPTKGKKPAPPKPPVKPAKSEKLVELTFKKNDEHVRVGVLEKKGLQSVAVGRDAADRKAAEHAANDALGSLGSCLSEAETESSSFRDATTEVHLTITGFQGQRVVVETYKNPASDSPAP